MTTSTLLVHKPGSRSITREELTQLPTPPAMGRFHRPIRFDVLVDRIMETLTPIGAHPSTLRLGVNGLATKLFGTVDLYGGDGVQARSVGFRTSTDQTMALCLTVGSHVFVCDNMAFRGDELLLHRLNTTRLDLLGALSDRLGVIEQASLEFERRFLNLQQQPLADDGASLLLVRAMREQAMTPNDTAKAADLYFARNVADLAPEVAGHERTAWALQNCMTRVLRDSSPQVRYARTQAVGKLFGI